MSEEGNEDMKIPLDVEQNEITFYNNEFVKIKELMNIKHEKPSFLSDELWLIYQSCFPWLYYSEGRFLCLFCEEALKLNKGMISSNWALGNTVKLNLESTKGYNISKIRFERHSKTHNHILAVNILSQNPESDHWRNLQAKYPWLEGDLLNVRCSLCDEACKKFKDSMVNTMWTFSDLKDDQSSFQFSTNYRLDRHELCKNHIFAKNLENLSKYNISSKPDDLPLVSSSSSELYLCSNKRKRKSAPTKSVKDFDYVLPLAVNKNQFNELQSRFSWLNYCNENSFLCKLCPEIHSHIAFGCYSSLTFISQLLQGHCNSELHEYFTCCDREARSTRLQLGVKSKVDYKRLSNGISDTITPSRCKAKKIESRPWACPQCNSNFLLNVDLVEHISLCDYQSTDLVRELVCPCDPVMHHFKTITKLDLHAAQEHGLQLLFHCYICSDRYSRLLSLYSHILVHHLIAWDPYESYKPVYVSPPSIVCMFCSTLLDSNSDLTFHYSQSRCKKYLQPAVVVEEIVNNTDSESKEKIKLEYNLKKAPDKVCQKYELKNAPTVLARPNFIASNTLSNSFRIISKRIKTQNFLFKKIKVPVLAENLPINEGRQDLEANTNLDINELSRGTDENIIAIKNGPTETVTFPENIKRIRFPTKKLKENAELNMDKTVKRKFNSKITIVKNIENSGKSLCQNPSLTKLPIKTISRNSNRTENNIRKTKFIVSIKQTQKNDNDFIKSFVDKGKEMDQKIVASVKDDAIMSKSVTQDINGRHVELSSSVDKRSIPKECAKVSFMERMKSIRQIKQTKSEEKREEMMKVDKTLAEINDNPILAESVEAKTLHNCEHLSLEDLSDIFHNGSKNKEENGQSKKQKCEISKISKPRNFACEGCQIKFHTLQSRDKHMTLEHKGERLFKCGLCETSMCTYRSLRRHAVRYHMDRVSYAVSGNENRVCPDLSSQCHYCQLQFTNEQAMICHVTSVHRHCETDQHSPSTSPVQVTNEFIERLNATDPLGGGQKCPSCSLVMDNEFEMAIHSVEHDRDKDPSVEVTQFACPKCCRLFFGADGKTHLKDHYNIYHLRKPLPFCEQCKSRFPSTWCYYEHKRVFSHCSKRSISRMHITDPYKPLNDVSRLAFVCSGCHCLIAGANAQLRFDDHLSTCAMAIKRA